MTKTCSKCNEIKDFNLFNKDKTRVGGYHPYCKNCANSYNKVRLDVNRNIKRSEEELLNAALLKRCSRCKKIGGKHGKDASKKDGLDSFCSLCRKRVKIVMSYGVTREQAEIIATETKCSLCGDIPSNPKNLHCDHSHKSLKYRSVLCNKCNIGLGNFRESPELLRAAAEYLEYHSKQSEK